MQAAQTFLSMTVYEMIQHHKEIKKEIRKRPDNHPDKVQQDVFSEVSHQLSTQHKAHNGQQQTMRNLSQQLGSMFETRPLQHEHLQVEKNQTVVATSSGSASKSVAKTTNSIQKILVGPQSTREKSSVCWESSNEPLPDFRDNEVSVQEMHPPQPILTTVQVLQGPERIRRVSRRTKIIKSLTSARPAPTSSELPADLPVEQSIEASAAPTPALSTVQQNLRSKAEQA